MGWARDIPRVAAQSAVPDRSPGRSASSRARRRARSIQVFEDAMKIFESTVLCIALVASPLLAFAQQKARPDPADAAASVAVAVYDSAFSAYVKDYEVTPAEWKDVNDEVGRIGGH